MVFGCGASSCLAKASSSAELLQVHLFIDAGGVGGPPSLLAIAFSFSIVK